MFKKTKVCTGLMLAFGGTLVLGASSAFAQQQLDRVEITGSAIKRIDAETAVPVTIIKVEDLKKEGVTTIEQIVNRLGGNQQQQGSSQSVGLGTGGAAFANLRGLGQNKTLVLLNGRRLANNAIDGAAPDLNMIPFAALERVEVLRDGASALYGTDAVGGVINFITRRDFRGGSITVGADSPKGKGGGSHNLNGAYGFGDLDKDRFNVFAVLDYQKQDALRSTQRGFLDRPGAKTSPTTFPGQYNQGANVENPTFPACGAPDGIPNPDTSQPADKTCGYLYSRKVDLIPRDERVSGLINGTLKIGQDTRLNLEYFASQNKGQTLIAGVPYGALNINPGTAFYPGNGITPLPTAFTLDPTYQALTPVPILGSGDPPVTQTKIDNIVAANAAKVASNTKKGLLPGFVKLRWRDQVSGGRQEETKNNQQRFVASLDGAVAGWDYQVGAAYNENKLTDSLIGGYTDGTKVTPGVRDGIINPFGDQTPAGLALLSDAAAAGKGVLYTAKGQVYSLDAKVSRELGDWLQAGRPAAIAVGTEFRREKFKFVGNPPFDALVINSTGFDPATDNEGSRTVSALYTELNIPLIKEVDITAAVRYDRYSDFGNTTNPKVSFRYQPSQQLVFRGSVGTGFRAPSLYDINAAQTFTNTANNHDDPIRCPNGVPIAGASKSDNCDVQFIVLNGGNKTLKPEKSKNFTLGLVFEPMADVSVGIDLWWIKLKASIGVLSDDTIFKNPGKYGFLFHRAVDGSLATDGSQCNTVADPGPACGYVTDTSLNLGEVRTSGVDLSAAYRLRAGSMGNFTFAFNGTYVNKYEYQNEEGGPFFQAVGRYEGGVTQGGGPIFRWQHAMSGNWTRGEWGAGLVNRYKSNYVDQDGLNTVGSFSVWDVYGTYQPNKSILITAGLRNLFDKDPPFSNQQSTFQTGYDPRYADPNGRTIYVRGTYSF